MSFFIQKNFKEKINYIFWLALCLFIISVSLVQIYDIDIWWHMQCGRSLLETFTLPDFSDYYFTPSNRNATSQLRFTWLGDIIFHIIYSVSGDIGLQIFRLMIIVLTCALIRFPAAKKYKGWHLFVLMFLVIGTYHNQLVRNALFALVLTPFIFTIWYQVKYRKKTWMIWLYPIILGVWSCLHGSYLMGFGLTVLIFTGDIIDSSLMKFVYKKQTNKNLTKKLIIYCTVILISFVFISAWNPTTQTFYNFSSFTKLFTQAKSTTTALPTEKAIEKELLIIRNKLNYSENNTVFPGNIKFFLNNTLFKQSPGRASSVDFASPFDKLQRFYVWVALFSGFVGFFACCFLIRPVRFSDILPFAAILFFGCGYLRLLGYISIISAVILLKASGENDIRTRYVSDKIMWRGALLFLIVMIVINIIPYSAVKRKLSLNKIAFGRISGFSEKCADKILSKHKNNKVFTTMENGGYLLYKWYPEKKVFADGFFAPHTNRVKIHLEMLYYKNIDPDFLNIEYGIDMALIAYSNRNILRNFLNSINWHVKYIDKGMICFVYEPDFDEEISLPEILFTETEFKGKSPGSKRAFADVFYIIIKNFYKKGRIQDGENFIKKNQQIVNKIKKFVKPGLVQLTENVRTNNKNIYGKINSKTVFYEFQHALALKIADEEKIISTGLNVLELSPDKLTIIINVAMALANQGEIKKSIEIIGSFIEKLTKANHDLLESEKNNLAKLLLKQSQYFKTQNEYSKFYNSIENANFFNKTLISDSTLLRLGLDLVGMLDKKNNTRQALSIIEKMGYKFSKNGIFLNEIAWQLFDTENINKKQLLLAESYAKKAIVIMQKNNNTMIDAAYDTLSQILLKNNNFKEGCLYRKKAIQSAPESLKSQYKYPEKCGDIFE